MKPRLLANENVPRQSVALLREAGFDVLAISESSAGLADHTGHFVVIQDDSIRLRPLPKSK